MMAAETAREHQTVVAAIARRDPRAARAAMRSHMNLTKKRYSKDWKVESRVDVRNRSAGAT